MFHDIDPAKISKGFIEYQNGVAHRTIPVRPFADITPPFLTCVSLDRTDGAFEHNLASVACSEGIDYLLFS